MSRGLDLLGSQSHGGLAQVFVRSYVTKFIRPVSSFSNYSLATDKDTSNWNFPSGQGLFGLSAGLDTQRMSGA
jgi:hypothetical protein